METTSLETTDIFRDAFFMCMGGDLSDIRFRNNGKQIATFLFTGPELHKHDKAYIINESGPYQFSVAFIPQVAIHEPPKNNGVLIKLIISVSQFPVTSNPCNSC